jgi:hypothetical protein
MMVTLIGPGLLRLLVLSALIAYLGTVAIGCQRSATPTETDTGGLRVRLEPGSQYHYTVWSLDIFGDRITSTERARSWNVVANGVTAYEFDDVTLVVDSTEGEAIDTLYFRFLDSGDIYQYGFFSGVVERTEGKIIPSQWDLIVALSLAPVGNWTAGVADSAGNDTVRGEMEGEELLFEIMINGMLTAVPAYRADLTSSKLISSIWVTGSPSAFVRLRYENAFSSSSIRGELAQLTEVTTPINPL